jgi:hypothetical protein
MRGGEKIKRMEMDKITKYNGDKNETFNEKILSKAAFLLSLNL